MPVLSLHLCVCAGDILYTLHCGEQMLVQFCHTCKTCQTAEKPNQVVTAPLYPITALGKPFQYVIVDCVGLLPKTKTGTQLLLIIICTATCYPKAIPRRRITAPLIIKALTTFFTTFGHLRVVQNIPSNLFKQVLQNLGFNHVVFSAYHPESQEALEK